uniref:Pancreatic progenitor cell differentiation and proliferation factor a n=1 Tax=Labrus bergylta TaxID=56723 RepID=A0A3Q3MET6_9LABR
MAAIPSSGSLIATHDYYRRRLGSASSNSSCGSAEYTGEIIPHHPGKKKKKKSQGFILKILPFPKLSSLLKYILFIPGLPRQDSGNWWSSFFFAKPGQPGMQNGSENQKNSTYTVANGQVTCFAREMVLKRQLSENSESGKSESTTPPPSSS